MEETQKDMSFLQHLEVLRWHLIRAALAIMFFMTLSFLNKKILFDIIIFGPKNIDFFTYKIMCKISKGLNLGEALCLTEMPFVLINMNMPGQFTTHIWVSFIAGLIIGMPYVLWEFWKFIKPALYDSEKKVARGVVFYSSILFLTGVLFGYYIIAPLSINFLGSYQVSETINNTINLSSYISTVSLIVLACGFIFELPIIVYFLTKVGLLTPKIMRTYRRHALVATLILSAVITPPDISSQILVAIPIVILYEFSIRISALVIKKQDNQ